MNKLILVKGKIVNSNGCKKYRTGSKKERQLIFKRDGYKCIKCGSNKNLTIDHIIPKSKGGRDSITNYQTMCKKCNSEKSNIILTEYLKTY